MLKNKTVLVAEDDSTMQMFVAGILRQELHCNNVITCTNGIQALTVLKNPEQRSTIDLILCDWEMPGTNGDEILSFIRKDKEIRHLPFIMTTSRSSKDDLVKVAKLGINNYLVKPFSAADLVERIKKVMETKDSAKVKKRFSKNTALVVKLDFKGGDEKSQFGTLYEISFEKGVVRVSREGKGALSLYDQFKLQIKYVDETINLEGEIRSLKPDIEDEFSRDFMMVGFKITQIDDLNKDTLKLLLG